MFHTQFVLMGTRDCIVIDFDSCGTLVMADSPCELWYAPASGWSYPEGCKSYTPEQLLGARNQLVCIYDVL